MGEEQSRARKRIVPDKRAPKPKGEYSVSSDPDVRTKIIVISAAVLISSVFLALCIVNLPLVVKEEYADEYPFMGDDEKRLSMKEGIVSMNLSFNTTGYWVKDDITLGWHTFLLLWFITLCGPIAFYFNRKRNRIEKVEEHLSDFLRDISESMRAGQTLHEAIKTSASGEYGALTPEIEKMAMQVSWGISSSKTLEMFAERVNTPLVKRAVTLINEASSAGGNVSNVIEAAAKDTREIQVMKKIRNQEMSMYKYVIAISFMVFLVVIAIIFFTFMPTMEKQAESYQNKGSASAQTPGGFDPSGVDFGVMRLLFLGAAVIQAVGDGIVGGIMASGRFMNGLMFSVWFALVTLLSFDLLLF
ncbi:MAG: type II secretion system F family protein [Candidatus Thermoplasmatota archaeon]|nr:type II secretion system F family protein [Candidatus Thermoplasmatota archaeon]